MCPAHDMESLEMASLPSVLQGASSSDVGATNGVVYNHRDGYQYKKGESSEIDDYLSRQLTAKMEEESDSESEDTDVPDSHNKMDDEKLLYQFDDIDDFPEGGFKAWTNVLGCFLGLTACFGTLNATGVIEDHIQKYQLSDVKTSTIGWIFSLFLFINYSCCIFSGTYFDRNGYRDPVILGTVLHVAGLIATANCTKVWHFILAFSIVCGFGNGILIAPLVAVPAHYFCRRRGTAVACATIGGSIGGVIFPIIVRKFYALQSDTDPNFGYAWGMRTWALIDLFLLSLSLLLAKERLPHVVEPEKYQNESKFQRIMRVYIRQSCDLKGFLDMKYLFCVSGTVLGEICLCSTITYFASYSTAHGLSESDAYMFIMVINALGIPGRWLPGYFSDWIGRFNIAIITIFSLSIVILVGWLPFGNTLANMYVISALYGFFSGSILSLLPVCCGQISKTEEFGKRYSTMYLGVAFGNLIFIPVTGAIIGNESLTGYRNFVIFCGVASILSALCFIISRHFCVGFRFVKF